MLTRPRTSPIKLKQPLLGNSMTRPRTLQPIIIWFRLFRNTASVPRQIPLVILHERSRTFMNVHWILLRFKCLCSDLEYAAMRLNERSESYLKLRATVRRQIWRGRSICNKKTRIKNAQFSMVARRLKPFAKKKS